MGICDLAVEKEVEEFEESWQSEKTCLLDLLHMQEATESRAADRGAAADGTTTATAREESTMGVVDTVFRFVPPD